MENFYLAYIINAIVGLGIGYVWGSVDGYRIGSQKSHKPAQSDSNA
jgi:hypothetical protein